MQFNIKDEAAARRWLEEVRGIHEDYFTAMKEAGQTMENVKEVADGTLVDEIVNSGVRIMDVAQKTFTTIDKIAETVTSFVDKIKNFSDNVAEGIGSVAKKLFG